MPEPNEQLRSGRQEAIPSEPIQIETEGVFDSDVLSQPDPNLLEEIDEFMDNPMKMVMQVLTNYLDSLRPKLPEPIKSEHKVRIFRLNDQTVVAEAEAEIEAILNEGYCCHVPTVCNDFLIMDFLRRKETKENEREQ